jgi:hypothetical protein
MRVNNYGINKATKVFWHVKFSANFTKYVTINRSCLKLEVL